MEHTDKTSSEKRSENRLHPFNRRQFFRNRNGTIVMYYKTRSDENSQEKWIHQDEYITN